MAAAEDSGYDCNFVDELPDELICAVCSFALNEPIQLVNCGHRLCKYCFDQLVGHAQMRNINILCPLDRNVINPKQVFTDKAVARRVLNLKVYCGGQEKGCNWIGEVRHLKTHEKSCSTSKFLVSVTRNEMNDLKSNFNDLEISVAKKNQEIDDARKNINDLTERCESLEDSVQQLVLYKKNSNRLINQLQQRNKKLENTVREITQSTKANYACTTRRSQSLENTVSQLKDQIEICEENYNSLVNHNIHEQSYSEEDDTTVHFYKTVFENDLGDRNQRWYASILDKFIIQHIQADDGSEKEIEIDRDKQKSDFILGLMIAGSSVLLALIYSLRKSHKLPPPPIQPIKTSSFRFFNNDF